MGSRLATIDMGRKVGAGVPLAVGHPNPSNRLATIHQRYKTDRETDNGPIA